MPSNQMVLDAEGALIAGPSPATRRTRIPRFAWWQQLKSYWARRGRANSPP